MVESQWGLMRGFTVARSAVFASVAAISVTRRGAQPGTKWRVLRRF
jgi:sugar/nucleoside kinase (ribokinase family)